MSKDDAFFRAAYIQGARDVLKLLHRRPRNGVSMWSMSPAKSAEYLAWAADYRRRAGALSTNSGS